MIVIMWIIFAFACSLIAESKGMSPGLWFFIGLLFGILALGVVLVLPTKKENEI